MARFKYFGDVNPEYGGILVHTTRWGYADVVRIKPCSDAGGPDNMYWIESLSVTTDRTDAEWQNILSTCGLTLDDKPGIYARIDACLAYGAYDQNHSEMVRVGKPDPFYRSRSGDSFNQDKILRGNTSILRYARRVAGGMA